MKDKIKEAFQKVILPFVNNLGWAIFYLCLAVGTGLFLSESGYKSINTLNFTIMTCLVIICGVYLTTSKKFDTDILLLSIIVGTLFSIATETMWVAPAIALAIFLILYAVSLQLIKLAKRNIFFTTLQLNQHKIIETAGGTLEMFVGYAERWIGEGANRILTPHMPHAKNGKVSPVDSAKIETRITKYFVSRWGIIWIGLAGITIIKKLELKFKTLRGGVVITKDFTGVNAVYTVFDSFIYLFEARQLETKENFQVRYTGQIELFVDNLFTIAYTALPAGNWLNLGNALFVDVCRTHAASKPYEELRSEKEGKAKEPTPGTLYARFLDDSNKAEFTRITGHEPREFDIFEFELEKDEATENALKAMALEKLNANAKLAKTQIDLQIAKVQTDISAEEGTQAYNKARGELHALETYAQNLTKPINEGGMGITDSKEIAELLKWIEIRRSNLQTLAGNAIPTLNVNN